MLHQYQREAKVLAHGHQPNAPEGATRFIEVTLEDIALANELAPEILGCSLDELPPQTRRLLGSIRELMKQKRATKGSVKMGAGNALANGAATFSRKELRQACGCSLTQVSVHLERLVALEYLAIRHGRLGSAFIYEILFDPDAPEPLFQIGLIDVGQLSEKYDCETNLTCFEAGVPGRNGHLPGGNQTGPIPVAALTAKVLQRT